MHEEEISFKNSLLFPEIFATVKKEEYSTKQKYSENKKTISRSYK